MARKKKMYIPAYKIAGLLIIIVSLGLILLYLTNKKPNTNSSENNLPPISQRFTEDKINNSSSQEIQNNKQNSNQTSQITITESTEKNTNSQNKTNTDNSSNRSTTSTNNSNTSSETIVNTNNTTSSNNNSSNTNTQTQNKPKYDFPKAVNNAQLVFVFDDAGQNIAHLEKFLKLSFPFSVAVLPQLPNSKKAADKIRESGKEVLLHQPMQAISNANPGPGAITPQMQEDEIISTLFTNITQIGPVAGMNNHEGSAITADEEKMAVILKFSSDNGIFFLDSRTNSDTKVPYVAGEMGYSYYERNIFLDNEKTKENALNEIKKALAIANKNGTVIMIGHITSADFLPELLEEIYPELKKLGYTFSVVSKSNASK